MKREWILWFGGACALVSAIALTRLLTTGFQAGSEFVREVADLREFQANPQPRFALTWPARDGMTATLENPRLALESVREHVERTLSETMEAQNVLPTRKE